MNIAIDATAILGEGSKNRGIGNYGLAQMRALLQIDRENQYFFLNYFEEEFTLETDGRSFDNLHEIFLWVGKDCFLSIDPAYQAVFGDLIRNFIRDNQIDVFYVTSPFDGHIFPYQKEWFGNARVVATVYDLIPLIMKDVYLPKKSQYNAYLSHLNTLSWMDKLLAISQSVKNDLMRYLKIPEDKIEVIYSGVSGMYHPMTVTEQEKARVCAKFGITAPFLMCTGGEDPRKNLDGLIEAYARLPQDLIERYQLAIVCKLSPAGVQKYSDRIAARNVTGRVILTNFVTDEELVLLYHLATLMAFPSQYEGFGLPVVEAFACGTPVLTSNNSSLGEIAEGAAVLVNPFDVGDIARGLTAALTTADRAELARNGYEKLKRFQWEQVAADTIRAMETLPKAAAESAGERRERIAFFTPLPPLKSGISDYSADMINALSDYFDIDVYIDDGYQPECALDDRVHIFPHGAFRKQSARYFDVIYQMGNAQFHIYMYPYLQKYPGTVVLHDYNLHAAAYAFALHIRHNDMNLYKRFLLEDYPADTVTQYLSDLQGDRCAPRIREMELNGFVVNYARRIIVHSDEAREKLLRKDIGLTVHTIRHYAKIEPPKDAAAFKRKQGFAQDHVVIASFGNIRETKRAMPLLKAFQKLCRKYPNATYCFVGQLDLKLAKTFLSFIQENGMEDRVQITGYVSLTEFENYMDGADICVNLRYPYNGETSGSFMRMLAKGKCVIVNNIGSFGEVPDDCCVKLPNAQALTEEKEVGQIYAAFERLVEDENLRKQISFAARRYAEETLDLRMIARMYRDFVMDPHRRALTETMLHNIRDRLQGNYTDGEIKTLGATLAYSLGAPVFPGEQALLSHDLSDGGVL